MSSLIKHLQCHLPQVFFSSATHPPLLPPPYPITHNRWKMWLTTLFSTATPDDTPSQSTNESSPLLHGSMRYGKREKGQSSHRTRYTQLPSIEEGPHNEHECAGTRRKIDWNKILLKGLKYILFLSLLVGVGFGAVAISYPCIFKSGL